MKIPFLNPPELIRRSYGDHRPAVLVSNWITLWAGEKVDAGIVGVPLAKGGRTYAGVDAAPNAIRRLLQEFTTYDLDRDDDFRELRVRHLGDVGLFATDVGRSQAQIEETLTALLAIEPHFVPVVLGGDHSVTYASFRAFKLARKVRTGLVFFGAQHTLRTIPDDVGDLRPPKAAILDDSMLRTLINDGLLIGTDVAQLGLHGFRGSQEERRFAEVQGITVLTASEVHRRGISVAIQDALTVAGANTDTVYVTINANVLDLAFAPAAQDGQFGGLDISEVLSAAYFLGQDRRVQAFDLVGVDAYTDQTGLTIRAGCSILMHFLAGLGSRKSKERPR